MAVLSLAAVKVGQNGVQPGSFKMTTDAALAAVTAAGFLVQGQGGQFFQKNDLIETIYLFGLPGQANVSLQVAIDVNGVITLSPEVVGALGTAATKNASDNTQPNVASVNGGTVAGSVATFADNMGTVTQNTANFRVQSVAFAGGAATATVTDANMQAGHSVFCQISTSANPVSIQKVTEGVGSFVVLMSADPGATTFKYMIVKNQ